MFIVYANMSEGSVVVAILRLYLSLIIGKYPNLKVRIYGYFLCEIIVYT